MIDQPRYNHDCRNCVFLATYGRHDLYFCKKTASIPDRVKTRWNDMCSSFPARTVLLRHTELMEDYKPQAHPFYGCGANSALATALDYATESGLYNY